MQFRSAIEKDFENCLSLFQQLWPALKIIITKTETQVIQDLKKIFCRLIKNPNNNIILAETDRKIIGLMDLSFRETLFNQDWVMIIEDLIIDKNYQRRGIGTQLVKLAEKIALQRDCSNIELNSDLHRMETHQFWEALGYERKAYQFRKVVR
jgi:GNAT superfamily N-acetyltransferase